MPDPELGSSVIAEPGVASVPAAGFVAAARPAVHIGRPAAARAVTVKPAFCSGAVASLIDSPATFGTEICWP